LTTSLRITEHRSFDELRPWRTQWDELARGVPFLEWAWLENWWLAYGHNQITRGSLNESSFGASSMNFFRARANHQLLLLAFWDQDKLIGVVPWYLTNSISEGHVIRFLGSNEVCGDYLTLLCEHTNTRSVVEELTKWLVETSENRTGRTALWDLIDLRGVFVNDFAMQSLMMSLYDAGLLVDTTHAFCGWRIELPGTWEEYLGNLSKQTRKKVRRLERTIYLDPQYQSRRVENRDDLERGWNILVDLHTKRWNALGENGCFHSARFSNFHRAMVEHWLNTDQLELGWIEKQGQPIAAEYQIRGNAGVYAYQSGIHPGYLDDEPGRLSATRAIRSAIGRNDRFYDLLRGDEPYKSNWRAEPHAMVNMRIVPNRTLARLRYRIQTTGQSMRRWLGQSWRDLIHGSNRAAIKHT
jgi:hypothetical protein